MQVLPYALFQLIAKVSRFNDDQVDLESRRPVEQFKDDQITPSKSSKTKTSSIRSGNSFAWSSSTTSQRSQADRVWKLVWTDLHLLQVRGRGLGQEIGTDLHLLQVQGLRPIRSGNWDKTNSQNRLLRFPSYMKPSLLYKLIKVKCLYIWSLIYN